MTAKEKPEELMFNHKRVGKGVTTYNYSKGMQKQERAKPLLTDDTENNNGCKLCLEKTE